ncbi:MAG: hypothetical protein IH623_17355 [Verrucomicrobia bacterium]|nr:hypothetical protein [Verrucomicrobiota bacterium]
MSEVGIILGIVVIVVVAVADIIVRLRIAPRRRDKFLENLLESMTEPEPAERMSQVNRVATVLDESLVENLLRHFELSATSRHVLAALALRTEGMSEPEVVSAVNHQLARQCGRELPATAVRKIVMILMGADLTTIRQGRLEITNAGRHLHTILQARSTSAAPVSAFASP